MSVARMDGKVAIVTGAGRGIGRAIAGTLAERGAAVLVVDIDGARAHEAAQFIRTRGGCAAPWVADATARGDVERMVAQARAALGGLDMLVSNVGRAVGGTVVTLSEEDWDASWRANVSAAFLIAKFAVPVLRERSGGSLVFVASTAGLRAVPAALAYCVGKAALLTMVKCLALDHGRDGIRVNALIPGIISASDEVPRPASSRNDSWLSEIPLGQRAGRVKEIADACVFLCSSEAGYITGQGLVVDGGLTAGRFSEPPDVSP